MAALSTALVAVGTAAAIGGSVMQYQATQEAQDAQKVQNTIRQDAMRNDANRRRREIMRQSALARATTISTATNQGAAAPGGSAVPGAYGQITGMELRDLNAANTAETQGNQMFALNNQVDSAYRGAALGGTMSSIGGGISSLGGSLQATGRTFNSVGQAPQQRPITINENGNSYSW
jgi:hypothetical protein